MSDSTGKSNEQKDEPASEQCIVKSAGVFCEAIVVLKGLPSNHPRAFCMGEYIKQERKLSGRSVYVGGRDGDMALYFDSCWVVTTEEDIDDGRFYFIYVNDCAVTPDRIRTPWMVNQGKQPAPSLRVRKFGGRETILEVSGLPSEHYASSCVGRYTRETCSHTEKPTYKGSRRADGMAIWFCEGSWRVGSKEDTGTLICFIAVKDCAHTPDVVQSTWLAMAADRYDKRVQVCGASIQQSSLATASQAQQLGSAPPKLAVIGTSMTRENYDGVYTKQQRKMSSRAVYEGGRNGMQAIWYHQSGGWVLGRAKDVGTGMCHVNTDHAATPDAIIKPWNLALMVPCSRIRVTKSKKKHTKVIEVKGVPKCGDAFDLTGADGSEELALMNGKYRQSSMVGGRLTFKGGQDGRCELWFDESCGKWRGSRPNIPCIGLIEATDTAAAPNAVKAAWNVYNGVKPSLYPTVIVPSVEAAEKEVPRLVRLKMCELVVAQHMRCLGCGHEYTAQAEVVFQMECMHHHCLCCAEKLAGNGCAVCAEENRV
jgi:hypothetical protein